MPLKGFDLGRRRFMYNCEEDPDNVKLLGRHIVAASVLPVTTTWMTLVLPRPV